MNIPRRAFLARSIPVAALATTAWLGAQEQPAATPAAPRRPEGARPMTDPALAREFVGVCHRDFEKVKAMVAAEPKLVLASVDTGNIGLGDWESGLNGAAHTGHRDIALFLIENGARIDAFVAAMLGYRDVVLALLKTDPRTAAIKGPHNLNLLYHAAVGGDVVIAEAIKPLLPIDTKEFNQSLSAAAREGRLEMTAWLLANGVTNVNAPDGFRKTPLKIALEKGYAEVAALLREHDARETL